MPDCRTTTERVPARGATSCSATGDAALTATQRSASSGCTARGALQATRLAANNAPTAHRDPGEHALTTAVILWLQRVARGKHRDPLLAYIGLRATSRTA